MDGTRITLVETEEGFALDCDNINAAKLIHAARACYIAALELAAETANQTIDDFLDTVPPVFTITGLGLDRIVERLEADAEAAHDGA